MELATAAAPASSRSSTITDDVRKLMQSRSDSGAITRAARDAGMTTMFEDGAAKCLAGVTSAAEVFRVTTAG